jgi:ABC-type nitrate/sulfonate/bicarbonate transport system permease component
MGKVSAIHFVLKLLKHNKRVAALISICGLLGLWEFASHSGLVNPLLFPPPSAVWDALVEWAESGELLTDVVVSYKRVIIGLLIGSVFGIILGMATGRNSIADNYVTPLIQILRPLPPVSIVPLVIVWFGIGETGKIFSISFACFFPVWINTHLGASQIPIEYLRSAKILTKSSLKRYLYVLVPATIPSIVAGLHTAIAFAFVMVYVSEIAGASSGIGYQISITHLAYRIDKMMAALSILALAGALADLVFAQTVNYLFPWIKKNNST